MIDRIAFWIATWFGAGLAPRGPGTAGSVATLPLVWALGFAPPAAMPAAIVVICAVGVWSAQRVADQTGLEDPQIVVIDEVAGVLLAIWIGLGTDIPRAIAGLLLFRLFDIWKPWPVSALERLKPTGVGIMADDIAAGLIAGLVLRAF
jgi:phosphatidylglycerophosphatase A